MRGLRCRLAVDEMGPYILEWDGWMRAQGEFCDCRDTDGYGRVYEVHRCSIVLAIRVCWEWIFAIEREDAGGALEAEETDCSPAH